MGITALNKREGDPCPNLKPPVRGKPGCACYATRPDECRTWDCMWLQGIGEEDHRPDKSGFLLASGFLDAERTLYVVQLRASRPGGLSDNHVAFEVARSLARDHVLLLVEGPHRTLFGTEARLGPVRAYLARVGPDADVGVPRG